MLTGGFAAQHSRVLISSDLLQYLFVATLALFLFRRGRGAALMMLGFLVFVHAGAKVKLDRLDPRFAGDSMLTEVRVVDFPKQANGSVTFLVEPVNDPRLPRHSRIHWFEPPEVPSLGDTWELELRLRRPRGSSNPGGFRLEDWMFRERIHASGYVVPGKRNRLLASGPKNPTQRLRKGFVEFALTHGGESAPVLAAVGVGTRHLLSTNHWDRYARTGTSHLMAISGLHIGLAASASFVILALVFGSLRIGGNHLLQAMKGSGLVAAGYALISGFAVPSQRATLMLAAGGLAFLLRRRHDSPRIVAVAAVVVYFADPLSLMRPGFALSFAAVSLLLWFSAKFGRRSLRSGYLSRTTSRVRQLAGMQIALLFGLIPLTTMVFQRFSILAPVVNLVAVPIFSLVTVPLTLLSLIFYPWLPNIATLALQAAGFSISLIEKLIALFASVPFASLNVATSGLHWLLVLLPALWVVLPRAWPGRWIAPLAVLALLVYRPPSPRPACFELHVLDVGQGLAAVVQTHTRTLLFDTGAGYRSGRSAATEVVLPFLHHRGIDSIDWLVVSHADNDHAGGFAPLVAETQPLRVYVGESIAGLNAVLCQIGQQWQADGVTFRFLHPDSGTRFTGNDASCVLSVTAGPHQVILTGDIESVAEREILQRGDDLQSDIVLVPHHGSLTSSSHPFVARLQPRIAIASAAFGNRWSLPRQAVVDRWRGVGARVLNTASDGAISSLVCADGGIREVRRNRALTRRFWHDDSF